MEWVSGNIFIRPMSLHQVGESIDGHTHNFDHTTVVFSGAVRIEATLLDGSQIVREFKSPRWDYGGPSHALIKADVTHKLIATEPNTILWCVYSHRNAQGDVVLKYEGWDEANG